MNTAELRRDVDQYLTFRLGEECYGIDVRNVREVLDLVPLTGVPRAPDFMLGVINLRGRVVPVVDLRRRFALPSTERTKDTCIVVVEIHLAEETLILGIMGDMVEEVVNLPGDQVEPPPRLGRGVRSEFIQGMGKQQDGFITLLDLDRVFREDDLADVVDAGEAKIH